MKAAGMNYQKVDMLLDLGIFFALFFVGLAVGWYVSHHVPDIWTAYNNSIISVILIGELAWRGIRKAATGRPRGKMGDNGLGNVCK